MITEKDLEYMRLCFSLAEKGRGAVSPNPLVGCVIVKDDKIIGTGWHQKFGGAHAEVNAIKGASEDLKGATLYCNLEPCSHTDKKTDPCVPRIVYSGIKRVVVCNIDPNPKENGNGIAKLHSCGIETEVGVLEKEGAELNKFFFKHIKENKPFITVKTAQTLNGKITAEKNKQYWLTGLESKKFVHSQRASYDAVLVGAGTINIDDPLLNVREIEGRNPVKIVLDGKLSVNPTAKIFENEPEKVWLFTTTESDENKKRELADLGCRIFELDEKEGIIPLSEIQTLLGRENISSVFVEGGARVFSQFISENFYDEVIILMAPQILPEGVDAFKLPESVKLKPDHFGRLGDDLKLVFKKGS